MSEVTIKEVSIPASQIPNDVKLKKEVIPLSGKLMTAENPVVVGKNFRQLTNMRYGDASPKSIAGMTKINSVAGTYLKVRNAFHYTKPGVTSRESHLLVQGYNSGLTASVVKQLTTEPPATGDYSATALWTDSAGAGYGKFATAPNDSMVYCNEVDTCIWGGDETRCARFINFDPAGSYWYDYTDAVNNTSDDSDNIVTFSTSADGIDAYTMLLLHLDNNVTDSSPTTAHTVTNNNVTFSSATAKFSYSGVFNGTTAYLTVPDNADFDLSGGVWAWDAWVRYSSFAADRPLYYQKTDLTKISFTGGAHEPVVGETIHGNTSTATGIIDYVDVASGDWGTSDAAGTIYMHTITGTWQNPEAIHDPSHNACANTSSLESDAGDNYILISIVSGYLTLKIHECYGAGSDVVSLTCGAFLTPGQFYHLEVNENGNNWYMFVNGSLKYYTSDSSRAKNYISVVSIGTDDTNYYVGYIDEYRLTKGAYRHIIDFEPPAAAYSTATVVANVYIGSIRPLKGIKPYISTANTSASYVAGYEWTGAAWSALSLSVDGTSSGGATLAVTGSITFTTTEATSKQKYIEGLPLYHYWFQFIGIDATTSIYYLTLDAPFQTITDQWCGIEATIGAFYKYTGGVYTDYTSNVLEDEYDTSYADTYADLSSLSAYSAGDNCVYAGFFSKPTAIMIGVASDGAQTTANTVLAIDYWAGSDWSTVGVITDGTSSASISLAKSGVPSWTLTNPELFHTRTMSNNTAQLYYIRLRWDQAMDASVRIYYVSAIPAQIPLYGYKFALHSQDRLMLCANMNEGKNSMLVSSMDTSQVFNGDDSFGVSFGDANELTCGCTVFSMYGSSLFNITLIYKDTELWGLVQYDAGWKRYKIADIGCNAPLTLDVVVVPPLEGQQTANRAFAIWVNATGVYTSDGRHPICVSHDIRDLFDQNATTHINLSYINSFSGRVDYQEYEYHMFVALTTGAVTTLDAEYVLDLRTWRWFKVDRGTGKKLQCAVNVTDVYGNNYSYGFIDSGYIERLEYGTTFDGNAIASTFHLGAFMIGDDPCVETSVAVAVPVIAAKATTTEDITMTHYIDEATTGTDYTVDPTKSGYGIATPVTIVNSVEGVFHSFKMTISTDDETTGFEPFALGIYYDPIREHDYV